MAEVRNPLILQTIPFLIVICLSALPAHGKYSGGTGEPNDPYQIATAGDLITLGESPDDYDKHFILTADIDLDPNLPGGKVFDKAVVAPATYDTATSKFEGMPFRGVFDGNGHTISHLRVAGTSCLGLFGPLNGAEVRNVQLIDPNLDGFLYVGALAGWCEDGVIIDCAIIGGSAVADSIVGGLVGSQSSGSIARCSVAGVHVAARNGTVGGLVSAQSGGSISDCSVRGGGICGTAVAGGLVGHGPWQDGTIVRCSVQDVQVQAYDPIQQLGFIGGLVGWAGKCTISDCRVTGGFVRGAGEVGGVIGWINGGRITGCYTATRVEANGGEQRYAPCLVVGGLAGLNAGTIEDCYTTSSVSQGEVMDHPNSHFLEGAGGLAGCNRGKIDRSYSTGAITGTKFVGGLVGDNTGASVTCSFWDIQTSGQATSDGGTGKTTAEMQTAKTFLDAGWDFAGETTNGSEDIWKIAEGLSYPRLSWEEYSGGTGEPNDPYQIATAADLIALGNEPNDYNKHFILTADIDLDPNLPGRRIFDKAVIAPDMNDTQDGFQGPSFTGSLDGNDHTISQLTIEGGGYVGLFGELASEAEVKALGVADANVTGSDPYVGGLVGYNYGTILTSHSTGMVQGGGGVGGLVGNNDGTIISSYSSAAVSGNTDDLCGGLVGVNNWGSIAACYSTGTVSGCQRIGGLAGGNGFGCIVMSYSLGAVTGDDLVGGLVGLSPGSIVASFWNKETSGQLQSAGGTGLTTTEMRDINTFLREGWDFVGESSNGTCDYWQMSPGDYPRLRCLTGEKPLMPQGMGTPEQPYLIRDARDLGTVWFQPRAHYRLEASVDLSEIMWSMAVVSCFAGVFDGNGHVVRGLHMRGAGYLGLFGELLSAAKILNLSLEAVDITGTCDDVGGLAGRSDGSIALCRSTGKVTGRAFVGVLLGQNEGDITTSYSAGTASGEVEVGGLAGWNSGSIATSHSATAVRGGTFAGGLVGGNHPQGNIIMSYSSGTVTGDSTVGGLVGFSRSSSIAMSYSTGAITAPGSMYGLVGTNIGSSITSSFWDTQASGRARSDGGIGKTTAEMQMAKTFLDAGWDFVGETANGAEDIWWIDEGKDYPRLWWEAAEKQSGTADERR